MWGKPPTGTGVRNCRGQRKAEKSSPRSRREASSSHSPVVRENKGAEKNSRRRDWELFAWLGMAPQHPLQPGSCDTVARSLPHLMCKSTNSRHPHLIFRIDTYGSSFQWLRITQPSVPGYSTKPLIFSFTWQTREQAFLLSPSSCHNWEQAWVWLPAFSLCKAM